MAYEYITKYNAPAYTPAAKVREMFGHDRKIESITIHWWSDKMGQSFDGPISWLTRPDANTSAHYVVEAGRVACLVDPDDAAWHAGSAKGNATSIGIECRPEATDADYQTAAELIAKLRDTYGNLPLIPHKAWKATTCPGRWDLARLDRLARGGASATRTVIPAALSAHVGTPGSRAGIRKVGSLPRDTEVQLTGKTYTDRQGTLWAEGTTDWSRKQTPVLHYWLSAVHLAGDRPATERTATVTKTEPTNVTETRAWFEKHKGQRIDMDAFPVGNEEQCVDIPKHNLKHVHGITPGSYGNGKDQAAGIAAAHPDKFTYHAPGTTRVQPGDYVSFGKPLGQIRRKDGSILDAGHVGVCLERVSDSTVAVADQDGYSSSTGLHRSEFPMDYITGIARPIRYAQED